MLNEGRNIDSSTNEELKKFSSINQTSSRFFELQLSKPNFIEEEDTDTLSLTESSTHSVDLYDSTGFCASIRNPNATNNSDHINSENNNNVSPTQSPRQHLRSILSSPARSPHSNSGDKSRSVRFNAQHCIIIIPSREQLADESLSNVVWFSREELSMFKRDTIAELEAFRRSTVCASTRSTLVAKGFLCHIPLTSDRDLARLEPRQQDFFFYQCSTPVAKQLRHAAVVAAGGDLTGPSNRRELVNSSQSLLSAMNTANGARRWNASLLMDSPPHRHNGINSSTSIRNLQFAAKQSNTRSCVNQSLPPPLQLPVDSCTNPSSKLVSPIFTAVPVECSVKEASILLYQNWHGEIDETLSLEFFR